MIAFVLSRMDATSVRSVTGSLGLLATVVLLGLLIEHEVVSAVAPGRRTGHRRVVELLIVSLLAVFAAVVVVRFKWLSL
jgi:hypothetical protein